MLSSAKEVERGTMAAWYAKFKTLQIGLSTALLPRRCFLACKRRSLSPFCVKTAFQKTDQRQYDRGMLAALVECSTPFFCTYFPALGVHQLYLCGEEANDCNSDRLG